MGLPRRLSDKEFDCQCRRLGFDSRVRKIPWRRKWQPTLVFLPKKSHGQRGLAGYSPWGHKESDMGLSDSTTNNNFTDTETPCRWEKSMINDDMLPTSMYTPDSWSWKLMMLMPTDLTTGPSEECPWADTSFLNHYYKTCHYCSKAGTHSFEGISRLCSPLPGKAINLSFSTSPKTLSPRTDLAPVYREAFPGGASGKEPTCQHRRYKRCGFYPWVGKIPWRRAWLPTPVFLPGKSHDLGSQRVRHDQSDLACTKREAEFLASYSNPGNTGTVQWVSRTWVQIPSLPLPV